MKLLINLGPLKKGGGQNVALNFVQALQRRKNFSFDFYFIVCENSLIKEVIKNTAWAEKVVTVSANPILRTIQEITLIKRFIIKNKIDLIYTYFGFGFFGKHVKQVVGSADSNLYFPEIDFWSMEKKIDKVKRYFIDKYRIFGLESAAGVVFENKAMYERAESLFKIKSKAFILPSIDEPELTTHLHIDFNPDTIKVLLLCGWQKNKNILLIPELASRLKELGVKVEFVITVEKDSSSCSQEFFELVERWEVKEQINCIGSVLKTQLPDLYDKIDQVLLLSLLESFSNNIIEAWHFKRPLIISDEPWSRAICVDAAYYVPRNDVDAIAQSILNLSVCEKAVSDITSKGLAVLSKFPSVDERLEQELKYLESFYD